MGYLNSTERSTLIERRTEYETMLETVKATYTAELENPVEEYRFDSGEGSQRAKRRKLSELKEQIEWLEGEIDLINRRLKGSGIVTLNVRRKGGNRFGRGGY